MEGGWRATLGVMITLACGMTGVFATGCGSSDEPSAAAPGTVQTENPERTFAPLVEAAADDPWRAMSARWFIERSIFWFAEDDGCADRKIAVGHTMPEQQNPEIDWIYPKGLGGWSWPAYFRNPYDAKCVLDFDQRFYADELTRPHDPGPRVEGIRPGEGFYLDLADDARPGPELSPGEPISAPVYAERTDEGDDGVRLTYWMLFGMHGTPGDADAHEGDWERIDVLLHDAGDDGYEPVAVQVVADGAERDVAESRFRDTAWGAARRIDGTHPVVRLAPSTHDATVAAPGGARCADCARWESWRSLAAAPRELWYGFGGAWGEVGADDASTGPLGPHDDWPSPSEKVR